MARPREFDTDDALNKAMQLFWADGFERASLNQLLETMGIQRSSFYNSFGDKRQVFLQSLEKYMRWVNDDFVIKILYESEYGLSGIEKVFSSYVDSLSNDKNCKGCLMINTLVELGPHDDEINDMISQEMKRVEDAFYNALVRAKSANRVPADLDLRSTAKFLLNTLTGMRVMGRQTFDREPFEAISSTALSVLKKQG